MYELKIEDKVIAKSPENIVYFEDQEAWLVINDAWYVDVDKKFTVSFVAENN